MVIKMKWETHLAKKTGLSSQAKSKLWTNMKTKKMIQLRMIGKLSDHIYPMIGGLT